MNGAVEPSKELDCYIKLKDLQLKHPPVDKISLSGGRLVSSDDEYSIFSFEIKPNTQRRIDEIQGECTFEINERDYPCSIVELAKDRVLLRIKELNEKQIKKGKIVVDMSHIIKMERGGVVATQKGRKIP